jgi:iron complex outermembrane receptor protein
VALGAQTLPQSMGLKELPTMARARYRGPIQETPERNVAAKFLKRTTLPPRPVVRFGTERALAGRRIAAFGWILREPSTSARTICVGWTVSMILASACVCADAQTPQSPETGAKAPTAEDPSPKDWSKVSIEDLMNIQVTSASKKEQKLSRVAAAIFVITQEDIRRSGATSIEDALRIVPGLDVAQINGSTWAIGARGFNEQLSNKLLVMVDGRIVYTEAFGGVYWDAVDLPLEDIDRIEVIRGPGGSIWGANAVNGIISIFTKRASAARGGLVTATAGNIEQGAGTVEYGDTLGKETDFRVFSKYSNETPMDDLTGHNGDDGWHSLRGGFRSDSTLSPKDTLTVEGNLYTEREGELAYFLPSLESPGLITIPQEVTSAGGFIQTNWKHQYSEEAGSELQISFTHYTRDDPLEAEKRSTFYVDYQNHFAWGQRQDIIWGLGDFYTNGRIDGTLTVFFSPPGKSLDVGDAFVQDEIAIVPDRIYLTAGTKLEHNNYTGFEFLPSIRATWEVDKQHMLWAAVSRSVRTPTPNDTDLSVNLGEIGVDNGVPVVLRFIGNKEFQDEHLVAYEAGYRATASKRLTFDLSAYFNRYDNLQTTEPSTSFLESTPAPPHEVETLTYGNLMHGESHGLEMSANWKVMDRWQLSPGFAFDAIHLHTDPQSQDQQTVAFSQGNTPTRMGQLRSHVDLWKKCSWDLSGYYVDPLRNQGFSGAVRIPGIMRVDTGLTWKGFEHLTFTVAGQNLLKNEHVEFEDFFGSMQSSQIRRSGYVKLTWQY